MNECMAYCCKKGFLLLSESQKELVVGKNSKLLESQGSLKRQDNGSFSLNFNNSLGGCPSLSGSKCTIHKDPSRPRTCDTFPIFINEETKEIRLSPRCFAVKENKLYPFIREASSLGYKFNNY